MTQSGTTSWHITPAGELQTAEFDGQTVVYHTGAGHTHWISPVAAAVLHELSRGANSHDQLHTALLDLVEENDASLLNDALTETLEHLKALDLIEAA